jgi:hypothetical protein
MTGILETRCYSGVSSKSIEPCVHPGEERNRDKEKARKSTSSPSRDYVTPRLVLVTFETIGDLDFVIDYPNFFFGQYSGFRLVNGYMW